MRSKKSKLMKLVEEKTGREIKELLTELYQTKTFNDIVEYFKCNYKIELTISGLSRWFLRLNIPTREWSLPK